MAAQKQHKYVSLEEVLGDDSVPKLQSREPNAVECQEESLLFKNPTNSKFPSSPSFVLLDSCSSEAMEEKKGLGGRFSCLKHSRSDDPLIYAAREEEEDEDDDELEILSQEMKNFSWKGRITLFSESEEEK
ncbi:hypothetical protein AAHA92_08312 [Salvia divinorum]|uniref:Uncharacterized protein n=1 Tax=Salvia divinorum TaxID=28513 RepID=A0ABD1HRB9_SALDI